MKYYINTYGCQMNVHESEKMAGILEKMGYTLAENDAVADVVVFNTCAVRESAEQKIFGNIGMLKNVKAKNPNMIIAVCGCMSQQKGYPELILKKYPYVDIIFGTHNIAKLQEFLVQKQTKKHVVEVVETEDIRLRDSMEPTRTSGTNAWVNINYGCNNFCTYCIVPYVRGREVSRPMEDIVCEVESLLKQGYKQITLLGQNVNSYGNDMADENITFANLLKQIDNLPYKFRLRFMSSHPKDLSEDVVKVMANSKNICHYLHLPVQSGSNKILKAMNRNYTHEHYMSLIDMCRKHMSDIEFSSDFIVGFPGETEEDFEDTIKLVKKVKYQQLFTFIYSKRKGTVAEKMPNQVDIKTKHQRLSKLIEIQREIATEISSKYIGKKLEVLVEGIHPKKKGYLLGSTDFGKTISFEGAEDLLGSFVLVEVQKSNNTSLSGKIVDILEKSNSEYRLPLDKIRRK
ncbi:MAG: tRNA (N6-isopentenyl adenosine(37)-C2)-methylthiotransferase MiaB [Clostridia bacterium]|nr:tRNA (N6-isopentenyl adenosine(37)-C2)-methylthiotransferase MiaB [Clostridia bacterium]